MLAINNIRDLEPTLLQGRTIIVTIFPRLKGKKKKTVSSDF